MLNRSLALDDNLINYLREHPQQYLELTYDIKYKKLIKTKPSALMGFYKEVDFVSLILDLNTESRRLLRYALKHRDKKTNKVALCPELLQLVQQHFSKAMKALFENDILVKVTYEKREIGGKLKKVVYLINPYFVFPYRGEDTHLVYKEWDNVKK